MPDEARLRLATADAQQLVTLRQFVNRTGRQWRVDPEKLHAVVLAVDELATNVLMHGYHGQPGFIEVVMRRSRQDLSVVLRDQAAPFDPTKVPKPDLTLPIEERPIGGVGLHLVREMMDELRYRRLEPTGNEVMVVKRRIVRA